MKRFGLFTISVMVLAGSSAWAGSSSICDAVVGNLVSNCGFEKGAFTNWTLNAGNGAAVLATPNSGLWAFVDGPPGTSPDDLSQTLATVAGDSYTISFYLMNDPSAGGGAPGGGGYIDLQANFDGVLLNDFLNPGAFGYTQFSYTGVASTGSTSLDFSAISNEPGNWFLDDVVVTQNSSSVPEPASLLLLGSGLIAITRRLRKTA